MNKITPGNINKKNLVIITSVINTSQNKLSYTKTRSIYTHEQRFKQTCETIQSIKKYIPNSFIVLLECGNICENYKKILKDECDIFINYNINKTINNIVHTSIYKGYSEITVISAFLNDNDISFFDSMYKISGRYCLNNNFHYNNYNNELNCFKTINSKKIMSGIHTSTVFYKITKSSFLEYIEALKQYKLQVLKGSAIERIITTRIKNIKIVEPLGVQGNMSVNGLFIHY